MSEENNHPPIILFFFIPTVLILCGCQFVHKCISNRQRVVSNRQILLNETENIEVTNVLHNNNLIMELEENSILPDMDTINSHDLIIILVFYLSIQTLFPIFPLQILNIQLYYLLNFHLQPIYHSISLQRR